MAKISKRAQAFAAKVDATKLYAIDEALSLVKECATAKFDESIDVAVQLGIDAKKSDQVVRGSPRATRLSKPRLPVLTSSAWKTWLSKSRQAT